MSNKNRKTGGDIFIVDNSDDDWKVVDYLQEWAEIAYQFDIATGYFEIGALLALDGQWQKLDKIRLLMGDEVSMRTKQAFVAGLEQIKDKLDLSIEDTKDENDFLVGVPSIVDAIKNGRILARIYNKKKFHAKAYITHSKLKVVGPAALVGSSNFTYPGLHGNVELNIQVQREVEELQEWYEKHWEDAEDITGDLLKTIERHTREYSPFDIYARAMFAYFRSHELSVSEWERSESKIYKILAQYQREGYHSLMRIAQRYNGGLLCDGVGLGKTFIGLMLIERLLFERKRVALFVPKSARIDVWEAKLNTFLPEARGEYSNLRIYNHTDLLRGGDYPDKMRNIAEQADAIIIDEAHHFRNTTSDRSRQLFEITDAKELYLLTATPINNSMYDLLHLIEYFSRRDPAYFSEAPLGIHSLRGHFRRLERALDEKVGEVITEVEVNNIVAEQVLSDDELFQALVVQRSRAYVQQSLENEGGNDVLFPRRYPPKVAAYSLKETYGALLGLIEKSFNSRDPLLRLGLYYPLNYRHDSDAEVDAFEEGRQKQIVGLIRTLLLKRFESSAESFRSSCEDLLLKLLYFVQLHSKRAANHWEKRHSDLLEQVRIHLQLRGRLHQDEENLDEDIIPEEYKKRIVELDEQVYNTNNMVLDTIQDMDELADFLYEMQDMRPEHDDKLQALINLMKTDAVLSKHKVLIFTEYRDTAVYIAEQLRQAGIDNLAQIDSESTASVSDVVQAFSPYYNELNSFDLEEHGVSEIRVLIATDILAEGLNLQDATCIINYDLHWNPVRLMQRIGRVDRRLDRYIEEQIIADHPEREDTRGEIHLWNFLPPRELNRILSLYQRVTHKTLRISTTFGIEGKQLLTPEDDYQALREFNQAYEGTTTSNEEMFLAYQKLLQDYPELPDRVADMPLRVFSGKEHPQDDTQQIFFCYRLPAKDLKTDDWTEEASFTKWYLYDIVTGDIVGDAPRIYQKLECTPDTSRRTQTEQSQLSDIRRKIDKHITNTYMKRVQAPVGTTFQLLAWMEMI